MYYTLAIQKIIFEPHRLPCTMSNMNVFEKVLELGLPTDSYVVVAGGVLVALGLLDWDGDIDLAVTPEVFERYKSDGWEQDDWRGKLVLRRDIYDIGVGFGEWSLEELQADAQWIQGVPFMSLDKLLQWKKQMGREKDLQHIALVQQYLARQAR